jgi:glycosyltransferase involved in cell wall biosynthesis
MSTPASVCFYAPSIDVDGSEHFAHLPALLAEIGALVPLHVIAGRNAHGGTVPNVRSLHVLSAGDPARRFLHLRRSLRRAAAEGCRVAFVRSSAGTAWATAAIGRRLGIRTLFWTCGESRILDWLVPPADVRGRATRRARRWRFARALATVDYVVTGPPSMGRYYHEFHDVAWERMRFLDNDVDLSRFRPGDRFDPDPPFRLLYVHRVSRGRGADLLDDLGRQVRHRYPGSELLVAGDGPLRAGIERAGEPSLRVLGPVSNLQVPDLLRSCDLLVSPSHAEGFPRIVLEAMATGTPFVTTDCGGIREVVGPGLAPALTPRGDGKAFVQRVLDVLADAPTRAALREHGLERVVRYDTRAVARRYAELFREVASEQAVPA